MQRRHTSRTLTMIMTVVVTISFNSHLSASLAGQPDLTLVDLTAQQASAVDWALSLFAEADLELPPILFVGHTDREACLGRDGTARPTEFGARIDLCAAGSEPTERRWILHEVAHAWDYHNLDEHDRHQFLESRNLTGWREGDWHERGAENAAEVLVWGLLDRPFNSVYIYANSCDDFQTGYLQLVGHEPLHGFTDFCG